MKKREGRSANNSSQGHDLLHLSQPEQVDKEFWYKTSFLSDHMLNQAADEALTDADRNGWQRPVRTVCYLSIVFLLPKEEGESRKDENLPSLYVLHSSLTKVCADLLKHYIVLKPHFTPNLCLRKERHRGIQLTSEELCFHQL